MVICKPTDPLVSPKTLSFTWAIKFYEVFLFDFIDYIVKIENKQQLIRTTKRVHSKRCSHKENFIFMAKTRNKIKKKTNVLENCLSRKILKKNCLPKLCH